MDSQTQKNHLIPTKTPDLLLFNKKKSTCYQVDSALPMDNDVEMKESEKFNKYLGLTR